MKTTAIRGSPGIRVKENGKFIVTKSIGGQRQTKEFTSLGEAKEWKKSRTTVDLKVNGKDPTLSGKGEGRNEIFFRDVYAQYLKEGMASLRDNTIKRKIRRMKRFLPNLFPVKMSEMNRRTILQHVQDMILTVNEDKSRRCNFDKELKDLSSIFTWYDEEITPFPGPITRKHFSAGRFRPVPKKKKDLPHEAVPHVVRHMKKMNRYAIVLQFLLGSRIGEACGINLHTADFRRAIIDLSETIVWDDSKPVHQRATKTDSPNIKEMTPLVREILLELKAEMPKGCIFFLQMKGKPLRYNEILKDLAKALKVAGYADYAGTHIFRYSMSSFARKEEGLDVAQAMLAHADARMTEGYAKLDVNKKVTGVVIKAERMFRKNATIVQPEGYEQAKNVI